MHMSLLTSAAFISAALVTAAPALAQDRSVSPNTNAPASGSADTSKRADTPPKTEDGTKNRNAGVIETDENRVAGDQDANDAQDKAKISDRAIDNAVRDAAGNASTTTAVGGTKSGEALSNPLQRKGGAVPPDGRASSPTESRPALTDTPRAR